MEILNGNPLVETDIVGNDGQFIGKVCKLGADTQAAGELDELTTLANSDRMAGEYEGNVDADGLVLVHEEEIDMEAVVLYGMELKLMDNGVVGLSVAEDQVYDVAGGGVGDTLEILGVDCEEDVLDAESVEVARDEALLPESLDDGFVASLTDLAFQFEMFHFLYFKMCYSVPEHTGTPLHQKLTAFQRDCKDMKNIITDKKSACYWTRPVASFHR